MGTPDFAVQSFKALLAAKNHEIVGVCTQPPRRSGRGHKIHLSPVHLAAQAAVESGAEFPIFTPETLSATSRDGQHMAHVIQDIAPDIAVVVAYGLILPNAILSLPRFGCVNLHASLLPRWRGAAPIQRAIMAGDRETGVQLMQMEQGLDTGSILVSKRVCISEEETGGGLHDRLASTGAGLISSALTALAAGELTPTAQSSKGICYAHKITSADREIDFTKPALETARQIAAFAPNLGVRARIGVYDVKIFAATVARMSGEPGDILNVDPKTGSLIIACCTDALIIQRLQPVSGKPMTASEWIRGLPTRLPCGHQ